jgi:hypothetical protein
MLREAHLAFAAHQSSSQDTIHHLAPRRSSVVTRRSDRRMQAKPPARSRDFFDAKHGDGRPAGPLRRYSDGASNSAANARRPDCSRVRALVINREDRTPDDHPRKALRADAKRRQLGLAQRHLHREIVALHGARKLCGSRAFSVG